MTVTITIDDAGVAAFNAFLVTQSTVSMNEITHVVTTTPHFTGIADFVQTKIAEVVAYVAANY